MVQLISDTGDPLPDYEVAADVVGAGVGEWVLIARGSSARQQDRYRDRPVDAAVIAIVDTVSLSSGTLYSKRDDLN
jgi:carbon dioxide concentrating mechanism protein CcmL